MSILYIAAFYLFPIVTIAIIDIYQHTIPIP